MTTIASPLFPTTSTLSKPAIVANLAALLVEFIGGRECDCISCERHEGKQALNARNIQGGLQALGLEVPEDIVTAQQPSRSVCYQPVADLLVPRVKELLGVEGDEHGMFSYEEGQQIVHLVCTRTEKTDAAMTASLQEAFGRYGLILVIHMS